jgi:transcription-repair coupling factor (superfamily II helicase)
MINKLNKLLLNHGSIKEFSESIRLGVPTAVFGVSDSFKSFLVGVLDCPVLYVAKDNVSAYSALKTIKEFSAKNVVYMPPKDQNLTLMRAFSKESQYQRLCALEDLNNIDVLITTPEGLSCIYPKNLPSFTIEKGQEISLDSLVENLVSLGYKRVETVESKGSFSIRGDIVDVFLISQENPIRIDLFGDYIESVKKYDVETRNNLGFIEKIKVVSASEFRFSKEEVEKILKELKLEYQNASSDRREKLKAVFNDLVSARELDDQEGLSLLAPISKNAVSIFDIISSDTAIIFDEEKKANETISLVETEFLERFKTLSKAGEVFDFQQKGIIKKEYVIERLKDFKKATLSLLSTSVNLFSPLKIINPKIGGITNYKLDFGQVYKDIDNWLKTGYSVVVLTNNVKRSENFSSDLSSYGIASSIDKELSLKGVEILSEPLSCGFVYHESKVAVIGSGNLYTSNQNAQFKTKRKAKASFFTAPEVGDYCVHETHGVGKVIGTKRISSTESTKDYIAVEYAGSDLLYVPVEQMDLLTRYLGSDKNPKLSKIGGQDFERVKKKAVESIKKMSFDLKKLYSQRNELKGFAFACDIAEEKAFNLAFPYEETPDQITSEKAVKKDMSSQRVMDRLICGDVGFGKTEVAFRAVFRAVSNGKQVAMLAPTTILTEQHFNTAKERFKDFGVKIACLNRFRTPKEQKKILEDLKNGKIDFIIGTHRLISKDVKFFDLGLLILDEEQRFGVEHKEKIKLLKTNVDTLTLTATPIPRTLHMSLSGIREISTITTPPKKRLPVQTYVTEESDTLIVDAITREVNRGGQAFVLYNRVESILNFKDRVQRLMPSLKITVVHGQMEERVMENNVMSFYRGETDVLISTTIIENGIDLPKANTLIVIDADRLGLSTLYQLKGRVGRSDRLAYAYFTFRKDKILTQTAFDRLNAIIEFTEMGSGIKIAMRDLEIRGAGNILGAEQHGHMDKIGYELYSKLLKEELEETPFVVPELDVRISAYIPEKYIEGNSLRMDTYKEIAEIRSFEEEREFLERTEDAYGKIPEEIINLVNVAMIKNTGARFGVNSIVIDKDSAFFEFNDFKRLITGVLPSVIEEFDGKVYISTAKKIRIEFKREGESNAQILKVMREFLERAKSKE